jgi:hypothetical protein
MTEVHAHATELTSQYITQVTADLERNAKEQERVSKDLEALQNQLRALQHDHTVLVNIRQTLGEASPTAETDTLAPPAVPHQASPEPKRSRAKKTAATSAKKPAAKASSAVESQAAAKPSLVNLIRGHLEEQSEPRSAAEITATLTQAHPDRTIRTTVVRTTLEGLVAKSQAQRTKQGSSVFYTAAAATEPAAAEAPQEAAAV